MSRWLWGGGLFFLSMIVSDENVGISICVRGFDRNVVTVGKPTTFVTIWLYQVS